MSLDYATIYEGMRKPSFLFDGRNILPLDELKVCEFARVSANAESTSSNLKLLYLFSSWHPTYELHLNLLTYLMHAQALGFNVMGIGKPQQWTWKNESY
jgi:hypothetical protein